MRTGAIGVDEGTVGLQPNRRREIGDRVLVALLLEKGQAAVVVGGERLRVELQRRQAVLARLIWPTLTEPLPAKSALTARLTTAEEKTATLQRIAGRKAAAAPS